MAHGRTGPDIVMTIRYVSASAISAVTAHELHRTPDGSSAIDPERTHLNTILHGPATQQVALDETLKEGVKGPAKQAEDPYVQIVLSASPEFFRTGGKGAGEWDKERLKEWTDKTMKWLRKTYGADLLHASLHLDEDTPHIHVLIVPTYEKAARKPGKPSRGESAEDFAARVKAAEDRPTIRTMGRSSNPMWSQNWARRDMRRSYHDAVQSLGLGYGKDFVGESQPSPENIPTGRWVREQAAKIAEDRARLSVAANALASGQAALANGRAKLAADANALALGQSALTEGRAKLSSEVKALALDRTALVQDRAKLTADADALALGQNALKEGQAKFSVEAKALASDRTALAHSQAQLASEAKALTSRRAMLDQGWAKLTADATALSETRSKHFATAEGWAERIRNDRAVLTQDQSALKAERATLENEKAEVRGLSSHLSKLIKRLESTLKDVLGFGPRIRSILQDAEASANERNAAEVARSNIVDVVPALRRDQTLTRLIFQRTRHVEPSTLEDIPEPVEETETGFGQP